MIRMSSERMKSSGPFANVRRTERVLLRVAILVSAQVPGQETLTEDTHTLVVNAHGALIALAMKVHPGQKLMLRNWATAKEQECQVIHVREMPEGKNEVGIAFPGPAPKFWNIDFPPPDWESYMK
jgi:hypothetical protein